MIEIKLSLCKGRINNCNLRDELVFSKVHYKHKNNASRKHSVLTILGRKKKFLCKYDILQHIFFSGCKYSGNTVSSEFIENVTVQFGLAQCYQQYYYKLETKTQQLGFDLK